MYLIGNMKTDS